MWRKQNWNPVIRYNLVPEWDKVNAYPYITASGTVEEVLDVLVETGVIG